MNLQEFFEYVSRNPEWIIAYFTVVPVASFIVNILSKSNATKTPWSQVYSLLIFMVAIPGLLAIVFNLYLFLFERRSIMLTNLITQILPIVSFIVTLLIIKRNVSLNLISGFGKVSSLVVMIFAAFAIMWVLDRTRIFFVAFTYMPFQYVILIFFGVLIAIRLSWRKFFK